MLTFGTLHLILLVGTCVCVSGNPVRLLNFNAEQSSDCDGRCASSEKAAGSEPKGKGRVTGLLLDVGAGSNGQPGGTESATQPENGDGLSGRSGPSLAGREASSDEEVRSAAVDSEGKKEDTPVTSEPVLSSAGGRKQSDTALRTTRLPPDGFLASTTSPQMGIPVECDEDRTQLPCGGDPLQEKDPETRSRSSTEPPYPGIRMEGPTLHSPIPPPVFTSPRISTPVSVWGHDGATVSSLLDALLPEIEPKLMPREDGPESLWTEAARPGGADTGVPLSQDEATEGTMSSEALPLIFEPLEDATPEGPPAEAAAAAGAAAAAAAATLVSGSAQTPAAVPPSGVDVDRLDALETGGPSNAPPLLPPDWTSPWQTSGAEWLEPIGFLGPSVSPTEDQTERGAARTPNLKEDLPSSGTSSTSFQHAMTTMTMSTHEHKSRSGLEEMESQEEPDEEEEDDNSEESMEDGSEEYLTETPKTSSIQAPYSLVPPPPVWVQRNQGLMRSWLQMIREKAGYMSGMLAPVGIGITGALLIVGALYSIRTIHRKRRNSFKHQRRKQPLEPGISRQDQAMLLADSSEDEF